jgi:hypothetical protein
LPLVLIIKKTDLNKKNATTAISTGSSVVIERAVAAIRIKLLIVISAINIVIGIFIGFVICQMF